MAGTEIDDIFAAKGHAGSSSSSDQNGKGKGKDKDKDKANAKAVDQLPTPPSSASAAEKTKKKRDKKRKRRGKDGEGAVARTGDPGSSEPEWKGIPDDDGDVQLKARTKRQRVVETVQDPSATLPSSSAGRKSEKAKEKISGKSNIEMEGVKEAKTGDNDDLGRFKDSRGTGPRKRTEEGFLVYKEDELGIRDAGGDTPLCPFDCTCCF